MFYPVPESGTRKKLIPDCLTHVQDSGTRIWYRFLVRMSWALDVAEATSAIPQNSVPGFVTHGISVEK